MKNIFQAISYVHKNNIVHRDIKPENLMFITTDEHSELKLVDFGISRYVDKNELCKTMTGTPYYVAPEIVQLTDNDGKSKGYSKQIDIWAAGVVMYIILCGCPPFYSPGIFIHIIILSLL